MAIGAKFAQSEQQIQGPGNIVDLREDSVSAINHGVGRRSLLGKVDNRLWLKFLDGEGQRFVIDHVAHEEVDGVAGKSLPHLQSFRQRADRRQRLYAKLVVPLSARKAVEDGNRIPLLG